MKFPTATRMWFFCSLTPRKGGRCLNPYFRVTISLRLPQYHGHSVGIYTLASAWNPITGSSTAFKGYSLWYAHFDNNYNFNDFVPFGGWTTPAMKVSGYIEDLRSGFAWGFFRCSCIVCQGCLRNYVRNSGTDFQEFLDLEQPGQNFALCCADSFCDAQFPVSKTGVREAFSDVLFE